MTLAAQIIPPVLSVAKTGIPFKNAPTFKNKTSILKQTKPAMPTTQRPMENSFVHYANLTNTLQALITVDLIEKTAIEMQGSENLWSTMTKSPNTPTTTSHTSSKQQTNTPQTHRPQCLSMKTWPQVSLGIIRTNDEIQPEALQAATRCRISINGN